MNEHSHVSMPQPDKVLRGKSAALPTAEIHARETVLLLLLPVAQHHRQTALGGSL